MEGGSIVTEHGRDGGKIQESTEVISEGKNVGRANETTPYEQALSEAESRWTKQVERKGYVADQAKLDVETRPGAEPMLAHRYDKFPEKIQFPCAGQPKLDGHRCIAIYENGVTKLFSRQRKPITGLPHIEAAITKLMHAVGQTTTRWVFDGELYNHDYKHKFEELTSHIRSSTPKEGHTIVQYHMYDIVAGYPFSRRSQMLAHLLDAHTDRVLHYVHTEIVHGDETVVELYAKFIERGYEGAMLRNMESDYVGRRSYDLLKVKQFRDEEFMVTGVEEGRGKMAGKAIFVCATEDGKEFRCKMSGSLERLADFFKNPEKCVNKLITVQFQDYTADGIPRFPVALRFREDL
jgi:DNA ligase-1